MELNMKRFGYHMEECERIISNGELHLGWLSSFM